MRGQRGLIRLALSFALLLLSLGLVVRRQSRALETLRQIESVRQERALLEAERAVIQGRIQRLESRARIVEAASKLGLRIPAGGEIVVLPLDDAGVAP